MADEFCVEVVSPVWPLWRMDFQAKLVDPLWPQDLGSSDELAVDRCESDRDWVTGGFFLRDMAEGAWQGARARTINDKERQRQRRAASEELDCMAARWLHSRCP